MPVNTKYKLTLTVGEVDTVLGAGYKGSVFEERFNRKKPETGHEIIFFCRFGVRSNTAAVKAKELGYIK